MRAPESSPLYHLGSFGWRDEVTDRKREARPTSARQPRAPEKRSAATPGWLPKQALK